MSSRVVILAGGLSPERDVSIRSARRVAVELRDIGVEVEVLDLDSQLLKRLRMDAPSCVVPLAHGAAGEDGSIQQILETLRLPFVGSPSASCRQAFDKSIAAPMLAEATGIAIPDSVVLPHSVFRDLGASQLLELITDRIGLPLIVKPTRGGSALGVSVVSELSELPAAMMSAMAYGDTVVIQRLVVGTEIAVSVIDQGDGPRALPPIEIVPDGGVYDYQSRYTAGATEFFVPARLSERALQAACQVALRAHELLGLRDWSRCDLIIDESGLPWFLETNVAPGMTETSLFPQSLEAAGMHVGESVRALIDSAEARRL